MQVVPLTLRVPSTARWRVWSVLLVGTVVFALAGLLGRATVVDGRTLSLVWPATGVGMLMVAAVERRDRVVAVGLVAVATFLLNDLTGASAVLSLVFVLSNVAQAVVGGLLVHEVARRLLRPRTPAGDPPQARTADVGVVLVAGVAGSWVGAAVGSLGLHAALGRWSWADAVVWWGRNSAGAVVVLLTVLVVAGPVLAAVAGGRRPRPAPATDWADGLVRPRVDPRLARVAEPAAMVLGTALLYLAVFVWFEAVPLAFPLLLPTVWVGLRSSPVVTALHGAVVCTVVLTFTVTGQGPFYDGRAWHQEALVSQGFVALVVSLGLVLALGRAERTTLTETLARSHARSDAQALMLSAIIDSMHEGLSLVDREGRIVMRNRSGAVMAGARTSADTATGQYTVHAPDGRELTPEESPQLRVFSSDGGFTQEVVLRYADGSPSRTLAISGRRLPAEEGGPGEQAVLVYHDVTADRRQRSSLESFAGVVAHDLRGPLSVVDGWSELVSMDLDEAGTDERVDARTLRPKVERIRGSVATMQQLIVDLLESSTTRDQALRERVVDLGAVARDVADQRSAVAAGEAPRIAVGELPEVWADPGLVRQLLDNLVSNAVKYVVPGEVPEVTVTGRQDGRWVEVSVADRGIGISPAEREAVFEPFHRAPTRSAYDGHGIGLSVCRRIVERHGGWITAADAPDGQGTCIVLTLPAVP